MRMVRRSCGHGDNNVKEVRAAALPVHAQSAQKNFSPSLRIRSFRPYLSIDRSSLMGGVVLPISFRFEAVVCARQLGLLKGMDMRRTNLIRLPGIVWSQALSIAIVVAGDVVNEHVHTGVVVLCELLTRSRLRPTPTNGAER
jgi:hypothetical protein